MEFKKKFKFSIRKLSIGVVSLSLGLTTLAQPIALLGQSNVAHAEENTPAAEKKAGKVTIERVDLDAKPEIQAGEEFKIKIKWVADPGQTNLGGLNSELNFDINTMEYVKVETVTPDGMGNSFINLAAVKKGKSRFGSTPFTNKELEAIFTFKAKRNITAADNYNFVFKAFPAPDGRVRWYTEPDYSGPTPLISSWEGLDADGTISVKLAKEAEATYNATYEFESATAGKELPQVVKDLLPTDNTKYKKDDQVTAKQPTSTEVADAAQDGKWVFKGYEPAGPVTVADKDVEFVGKWEYKANPVAKYTVGYKFESETAGKELPQEVKDLLPTDANEYENGAQVDAKQPAKAEVEVADGKWVFKGYAANSQTVNGSNVEFVGKWAFEAKQVTKYTVDYAFASSTAGKQLPGEVLALIPTDSKEYTNGEEVIAKDPAKTEVEVADGKWTFDGYQQNKFTVNNANVTFQGTWTFTAKPKPPVTKYKATYEFTSTDATKALPAEVLALKPVDNAEYVDNDVVTAQQPAKTKVEVADGTWTFNGYAANQQTVNGSDVKFSGTWTFTANATPPANKYKATYEFKSADATKALPNGVLRLLPNDTKEYANGDKAKAIQPAVTSVVTPTGTWTFAGYDANEKTINGAGVKFTGTWTFTASQTPPPAVEKKGSVIVRYVSTDDKKLKDDYIDTKDAVVGTPYNTAENETERPSVIVKDGVKYELVEIKGNPRGKVVEGTTVVTYVYKKVAQQPGGTDKPWDPFKPGEQKPTKPGKGKLANTGQTTTNAGIAGVALAGLALAAMRRRKNK